MPIEYVFPTKLYKNYIKSIDVNDVIKVCKRIEKEDEKGRHICIDSHPFGYTSYFTMEFVDDPIIDTLMSKVLPHAFEFAKVLKNGEENFDLEVFSNWINIGRKYNYHGIHNHANCFISGIFYLTDVSSIKFFNLSAYEQESISYPCRSNLLLLWPGWVYHEAQQIMEDTEKIIDSFII